MIIVALFVITTLRKNYIKKHCEPFMIEPSDHNDLLLDQNLKVKHTSYRTSAKHAPGSPMSSFEQTTNNQLHTSPNNGSITLPELAFY